MCVTNPTASMDVDLDRLDDATLMGAFDQMSLQNLVRMAKHSERIHEMILTNFVLAKYRLHESLIDIDATRRPLNILHGTEYIAYGNEESLAALELFGSAFTQLHIIVDVPGCPHELLAKLAAAVAQHCSQASQTIEMSRRNEQFEVNFSFPHAKVVKLFHQYDADEPVDPIDLNAVFPRMEHLQTTAADYLRLNRNFPHLTHFKLLKSMNAARFLRIFIESNPQLRGLETPMLANFPHLQKINELLPNLEVLGMEYTGKVVPATDIIRFENVKQFALDVVRVEDNEIPASFQESLSLIQFDQLRSFQLKSTKVSAKSKAFLLTTIAQHNQLTNLELERFDLSADDLLTMVNQLPQLETITLSCTSPPTVAEVRTFLLAETNLKEIRIFTGQNGPNTFYRTKDPIGQWQVVGRELIDFNGYAILRKVE